MSASSHSARALARVPHRRLGAGHVHDLGWRVHRRCSTIRARRVTARSARQRSAARPDRRRDGTDRDRADLLAVGQAVGRTHESGRHADISAARSRRALGCAVLHRWRSSSAARWACCWCAIGCSARHSRIRPSRYVATLPALTASASRCCAEFAISFVHDDDGAARLELASACMRYTGFCAGALVAIYIGFEAPLSGMSMNPARSFASAPCRPLDGLWIYFVAPVARHAGRSGVCIWHAGPQRGQVLEAAAHGGSALHSLRLRAVTSTSGDRHERQQIAIFDAIDRRLRCRRQRRGVSTRERGTARAVVEKGKASAARRQHARLRQGRARGVVQEQGAVARWPRPQLRARGILQCRRQDQMVRRGAAAITAATSSMQIPRISAWHGRSVTRSSRPYYEEAEALLGVRTFATEPDLLRILAPAATRLTELADRAAAARARAARFSIIRWKPRGSTALRRPRTQSRWRDGVSVARCASMPNVSLLTGAAVAISSAQPGSPQRIIGVRLEDGAYCKRASGARRRRAALAAHPCSVSGAQRPCRRTAVCAARRPQPQAASADGRASRFRPRARPI